MLILLCIFFIQIRKRINGCGILRWEQPDSNNSIINRYGRTTRPRALLARAGVPRWLEDEYFGIRRRHPRLTVFRCVYFTAAGTLFIIGFHRPRFVTHVRMYVRTGKKKLLNNLRNYNRNFNLKKTLKTHNFYISTNQNL